MDVGVSKGLVAAVISAPIQGQWEGSSFIDPESSGSQIASTVGAALGSSTESRVGVGILQGKVNQGLSFGSALAGQGNPLDALRDRSRGQFNPAAARAKRRDDWAVWIEVQAESIRRMREMLPSSDERRKDFRILLMGFRESRKLASERLARFKPTSDDLRGKVQKKLAATNEVLDAAAERKAIVSGEFLVAQQEKSEVARKHEALQGRKNQIKSLRSLAIQLRAATKQETESEVANDKSAQKRLLSSQAIKQQASRESAQSVMEKAATEANFQEKMQREKAMSTAELMAPKPKSKMEAAKPDRQVEATGEHPRLAEKGGIKSLFEQLTKEDKGVDERVDVQASGGSLEKAQIEEKRASLSEHEDTEDREPPVKEVVGFKNPELPVKTVSERIDAPLPAYRADEKHLVDSREIESSSRVDARELRDEPVRLTRKELVRETQDTQVPKLETQTQTDGIASAV